MRVIAGTFRGKVISAPEGMGTRPTADRARESLFNILNSLLMKNGKLWSDLTFADVFSGSGAIGIEALSRGARDVFCIENDPAALITLKKNVQDLSCIHILNQNALTPSPHSPVDVLFMDAPYGKGLWQKALSAFQKAGWIEAQTLIIIETDHKLHETLPIGYTLIQERSQGRNTFLFAKREV